MKHFECPAVLGDERLLSKFGTDPQADFATGFRTCLLGMVNAASAQSMLIHFALFLSQGRI